MRSPDLTSRYCNLIICWCYTCCYIHDICHIFDVIKIYSGFDGFNLWTIYIHIRCIYQHTFSLTWVSAWMNLSSVVHAVLCGTSRLNILKNYCMKLRIIMKFIFMSTEHAEVIPKLSNCSCFYLPWQHFAHCHFKINPGWSCVKPAHEMEWTGTPTTCTVWPGMQNHLNHYYWRRLCTCARNLR